MRRVNVVLSVGILLLFLVHMIGGSLKLVGLSDAGSDFSIVIMMVMSLLVLAHIVIGVIFTSKTVKAAVKSGSFYFKDNIAFLTRRMSGLAVFIFMICHMMLFSISSGAGARLEYFNTLALISQICFVVSIAVHVLSNIRPLMIGFGFKKLRKLLVDILFVLAVMLIIAAVAFVIYYLRWTVFWR